MKTSGPASMGPFFDGRFHDPEFGVIEGEHTLGKVTSLLAIFVKWLFSVVRQLVFCFLLVEPQSENNGVLLIC
jgi:hypothetical protein